MCCLLIDLMNFDLQQLATAHVPNKDSERGSDADIGRKEVGVGDKGLTYQCLQVVD
jgi:hypothetical protein